MITPDSNGESEIGEKGWTDEARAAALAARRALSGKAARADAQNSAKRLMDERRRVMAAHKAPAVTAAAESMVPTPTASKASPPRKTPPSQLL